MHSNVTSGSQIAEVLAITHHNISNLEEGKLANAELQLVALAESRKRDQNGEYQDTTQVPHAFLKEIGDLKQKYQLLENLHDPLSYNQSKGSGSLLRAMKTYRRGAFVGSNTFAELLQNITIRKATSSMDDSVESRGRSMITPFWTLYSS